MNIAVYCASREGNSPEYLRAAREVGAWIGKSAHALVYGGSQGGLMGAVADAALENGARVTGVIPDIEVIKRRRHPHLTQYVYTDTMAQRRTRMIELADAFVALPGGLGTLDEVSEVLSLASLELVKGKMVLFGALGYYEPLKELFKGIVREGFGEAAYFEKLLFTESIGELAAFLEG